MSTQICEGGRTNLWKTMKTNLQVKMLDFISGFYMIEVFMVII